MPVFIVGFARSGTTLCQRLVAERLQLHTLPETHFFERLGRYGPIQQGRLQPEQAAALLDELSPFLDIDRQRHEALLQQAKVPVRALFLSLIEEQIGSAELARAGHWLEKTPMHGMHLATIQGYFPKARFIAMLRNPLTAFASRRELSEPGKGWGEEWKPIEAYCQEWLRMTQQMLQFQTQHPEALLTVRLEDLSSAPDETVARIGQFLGRPVLAPEDAHPLATRIVQPFETWKLNALGEVQSGVAQREGRLQLDDYEAWRVSQLLAEPMAQWGYAPADVPPPSLDPLHQRLLASVDWYRGALARAQQRRPAAA